MVSYDTASNACQALSIGRGGAAPGGGGLGAALGGVSGKQRRRMVEKGRAVRCAFAYHPAAAGAVAGGRGLHLSTFQLNLSQI
jgi:hypothetical protein